MTTSSIRNLIDQSNGLPEYDESTPGVPLEPPLLPEELQFYYRSPRTRQNRKLYFLHNKYIMLFCLFGNRRIEVEGKDYLVHPGEFLLIPPQNSHTTNQPIPQQENEDFGILYASFLLPHSQAKIEPIVKQTFPLKSAEIRILLESVTHFRHCFDGDPLGATSAVYTYSIFLMRLLNRFTEQGKEQRTTYLNKNTLLLKKVQTCIQAHQNTPLPIADIAHELGVSQSLLRLIFRKEMKMSLGHYILTRRMHKINALLRSTDMSLSEIAAETGYNSEASMIRAYKRESGMTPRKAREKLRMAKMEVMKSPFPGKMESAANAII